MAAAFVIPSIFTAIDKLTSPVRGMGRSLSDFAMKAEAVTARSERLFKKLTPALSGAAKEFLAFASTAAITAAVFSGITFSVKSLQDYETAVASFRTIVSDLSDKDFAKYQDAINAVAKDTKKSSVDTAAAFEKIAGLNAKFAETAEGISAVSKAAIVLSKASGDELGTSAENLVGIMNQFSLEANQADRAINVLAAGAGVGAASITSTAESFVNFGSVAAGANITLEESVGLIQTLGKFSVLGAEAGTKLRGSVLKLQQAGVGYASGQFNINDALEEAKQKIDKLSTAKAKDAALTKMFGAENISTGRTLLANIELYKQYTAGVTGTSAAQAQADIRSKTLTVALEELSATWVNLITGTDKASTALDGAKVIIGFVTRNLDTIVSVGVNVLLFFAAWKALLIGSKIALAAYNIGLGINNALQKRSLFYTEGNIFAKRADLITTKAVTAAQWLWNAAMSANPIGLIIIGIAALIALVVVIIKYWNEWGAALSFLLGPLGFVISLIQSFRRNWEMITKSFENGGFLGGIIAIGKVLLDAVLMPLQQILAIIAKVTGADWAASAVKGLEDFRKDLGVNVSTDESGNPLPVAPAGNPESTKQDVMIERMQTNNSKVDINLNDPTGRAEAKSDSPGVNIKTTSTMGF